MNFLQGRIKDLRGRQSQGNAITFDHAHFVLGCREQKRFDMPGTSQHHVTGPHIEYGVGHTDKKIFAHVMTQHGIQPPQRLGRAQAFPCRHVQKRTAHGHNDRAGDTLAGDIAHNQAQVIIINGNHIIVVATDLPGRHTECRHMQTRYLGKFLREQCRLDLPSDAKVIVQPSLLVQRDANLCIMNRDRRLINQCLQQVCIRHVKRHSVDSIDHRQHTQHLMTKAKRNEK